MRRVSILACVMLVAGIRPLAAQTAGAQASPDFSLAISGGLAAGHASGSLVSIEAGKRVNEAWDVFLEVGRVTDTRTDQLDADAELIRKALGSTATVTVKQPANFGDVGVRYKVPAMGRALPYVMLGVGVAKVTKNVDFAVGGTNVNSVLASTYGVQLGDDLTGGQNKAMFSLGAGVQIAATDRVFVDVSYRFGRIFTTATGGANGTAGLNLNRLQGGVGVRF